MNQGIVPAGVLTCPTDIMAQRLGFKELVDISSFKLPYPHNAVATRRPLLRQNPDLFRGFLKSYLVAIKIIHEEPDVAKRSLSRHFGSKDPEMVDDAYRRLEALLLKVYREEEGGGGTKYFAANWRFSIPIPSRTRWSWPAPLMISSGS
jgi:ABC-type nitrate/sulfonate/bicarbonate transport system substrate-binding protein